MRCSECGVNKDDLRRCTGCYIVQYCSRKCQWKHWTVHKPECEARRPKLTSCGQDCEAKEDKSTPGGQYCAAKEIDTHAVGLDTASPFAIDPDHLGASNVKHLAAADSSTGSDTNAVKPGANKPMDEDGCASGRPGDIGICCHCEKTGITRTCSRCKMAKYCDKTCQKRHWPKHRRACFEQDDADDFTESAIYKLDKRRWEELMDTVEDINEKYRVGVLVTRNITHKDFGSRLSPEKMRMCAKRPVGSLAIATELARSFFPRRLVISDFTEIPYMDVWLLESHVVLAFIFRYHFNVCRHAVYLKDKLDQVHRVEFYLDGHGDNPAPYFSYSDVRPGNYICLVGATIHRFNDGTVGIKMEDPRRVRVIGNEILPRCKGV